ncbi:MAG TPA: hypothetical protein VII99_13525 [Bacteroidia bacterium]
MNDDVIHLIKILEVALIAGVKFAFAPFEAERQGFNFKEAFLITTAGGIFGILTFFLLGEMIAYGWKKMVRWFEKPMHLEKKPVKKFTWTKKFIVRTKMKFGLAGLAIVTPSIISIPIGSLVIHKLYRNRMKSILLIILSLICWSLLLNTIAQQLALSQYISK